MVTVPAAQGGTYSGTHQECMNLGTPTKGCQASSGGSALDSTAVCDTLPVQSAALTEGPPPPAGAQTTTPTTPTTPPSTAAAAPAPTTPNPTTTTTATTKPQSTTIPQPTGDIDDDISSCKTAARNAVNCCNNPYSCMSDAVSNGYVSQTDANNAQGLINNANQQTYPGETQQQSMQAACQQMQNGTLNSTAANSGLGSYCGSLKSTCSTTCKGGKESNPDSTSFDTYIDQCSNLTANAAAMGNGAYSNQTNAGAMASQCQQMAGMQPQSLNQPSPTPSPSSFNPNDPYGCQSNPSSQACQSCQNNPASPTCQALANRANVGQAALVKNDTTGGKSSDFNAGDLADQAGEVNPMFGAGAPPGPAAKVPTIPNNGGGAQNLGANDPKGPVYNGPAGPRYRPSAGGSGFANIDQGFRSGGGYQAPLGNGNSGNFRDGSGGRGPASKRPGIAMDLKNYLPGGDLDPRKRPGVAGIGSGEIGSRFGDVWKNITNRMQEKCRLGELIDCR